MKDESAFFENFIKTGSDKGLRSLILLSHL